MFRLLAFTLLLSLPATVWAQDDDTGRTATARVLFEEGLQFSDREEWERAIERFEQTLALRNSGQVRYNLAQALIQVGRLVEASEQLNQVVNDLDTSHEVREAAAAGITSIIPRLGRLRVVLEGELGSAELRLDERVIDPALLNIPVICDPGRHRLQIQREGAVVETREVDVAEGQLVETRFSIAPPLASVAELGAPSEPEGTPLVRRWWFWTLIGAAVAGGVTAGLLIRPTENTPYQGTLSPGLVVFE